MKSLVVGRVEWFAPASLTLRLLQEARPYRQRLAAMGVAEVYRSQRITLGKHRNFTPPPMPKPKRPASNRAREHRIEQEIVVDAYDSGERAISWHCYLDEKLRFPFKAKCIAARVISPLETGEEVEVLGMAPEDDCMREMFVLVGFAGRRFGVPLVQLEPVKPDQATREAVADWRYWVARGYEF